jgi:hypothetical protein
MRAVQTDDRNYRALRTIRVCFLVAYAVALDPIQSWDAAKVFYGFCHHYAHGIL